MGSNLVGTVGVPTGERDSTIKVATIVLHAESSAVKEAVKITGKS
jgi:hypothetical protein